MYAYGPDRTGRTTFHRDGAPIDMQRDVQFLRDLARALNRGMGEDRVQLTEEALAAIRTAGS